MSIYVTETDVMTITPLITVGNPYHYDVDQQFNKTTHFIDANGTVGNVGVYRSTGELLLGSLTFCVIMIMTILGNALVIMSVFTYRPLKKVQNYFIVSLAAADFTVASLVMPLHLVKFLLNGKWIFPLAMCQIWLTLDILCCTASILNLTAIAIDRYWAIRYALEYANKRTFKLVMTMITIVWLLSAIISIPPLIGWNDWTNDHLLTTCELTTDRAFVVYSAFGSFYLPLAVMTVVYIKIFIAARARIHKNRGRSALNTLKVAKQSENNGNNSSEVRMSVVRENIGEDATLLTTNDPRQSPSLQGDRSPVKYRTCSQLNGQLQIHRNSSIIDVPQVSNAVKAREKISVSKEKKAAKTLAVIMGVFVLCWLPFFLMYVILPFCESRCFVHPKVVEAITWLGYINSAINPVIYTIFNMDFRRGFQKIICPKARQAATAALRRSLRRPTRRSTAK